MRCLDTNTIYDYALGDLSRDDRDRVAVHVDACSGCRELVAEAVRDADRAQPITVTGEETPGGGGSAIPSWERYRDLVLIGSGGSGDVYRAYDPRLRRPVALKFLRRDAPELARRFLIEARAQARVDHPRVCRVFEAGSHADRHFIAMQLIRGQTLHDARAAMTLDERVRVMAEVADAVHAAHRLGIVHRDLKPSNILVERSASGEFLPYVTDFGLARALDEEGATISGTLLGTPAYMAPEQARGLGHRADRRTDVYALGATLYALTTGQPPFSGASTLEVLTRVLHDEPAPPRQVDGDGAALPRDLAIVILKCLEKDPERRYPSARALAEDLRRHLDGEPIAARRAPLARLLRRARRHRAALSVAGAALIALGALGATAIQARVAAARRARAIVEFGADSRDIEAWMRMHRLLPLHDLSPAYAHVRERMRDIDERRRLLGPAADGPGRYALGRGHYELGEYEQALDELGRAWDAGYREPPVAAALGLTLHEVYKRELLNLETVPGARRADRRRELERLYRDRAIEFLRRAGGAGLGSAAYADALIAYDEHDFARAIAQAKQAQREAPWLHEAIALEGTAYATEALLRESKDGLAKVRPLYDAADEAYRRAAALARSDTDVLLGRCRGAAMRLSVACLEGKAAPAEIDRAIDACDQALVTNPRAREAIRIKANLRLRFAAQVGTSGGDAGPILARAKREIDALLAPDQDNDKEDWSAQLLLGRYYQVALDAYQLRRGIDPRESIDMGIAAYLKTVAAHTSADTLGELANLQVQRANYLAGHGGEGALTAFDDAIADYERAGALHTDVREPVELANLGQALTGKALYEAAHSRDPRATLARAEATLREAVLQNPMRSGAYNLLAAAAAERAYYTESAGGDPRAALDEAVGAFRRAVAIDPTFVFGFDNIAEMHALRAASELRRGGDPEPALDDARRALDEGARITTNEYLHWRWLSKVELLSARARLAKNADAAAPLRRARQAIARALTLGKLDPDVHLGDAELARWEAEAHFSGAAIAGALGAVERALAIDPGLAAAYALRGEILLVSARHAGAGRARIAGQARAAFAEALRLNANERPARATLIAEAERLAGPAKAATSASETATSPAALGPPGGGAMR